MDLPRASVRHVVHDGRYLMVRRTESRPVCGFCKCSIGLAVRYSALADEFELPRGTGIVICTPACPDRPPSAKVVRRGRKAPQ